MTAVTAEHSVLHDSAVTDGSNLRVRDCKERVRTNSRCLPATITSIPTPYGVHADHSHQPYDAGALNRAVPQRKGGGPRLAGIRLHRRGKVFESIVDEPVRNGSTERQHQELPSGTGAKQ